MDANHRHCKTKTETRNNRVHDGSIQHDLSQKETAAMNKICVFHCDHTSDYFISKKKIKDHGEFGYYLRVYHQVKCCKCGRVKLDNGMIVFPEHVSYYDKVPWLTEEKAGGTDQ